MAIRVELCAFQDHGTGGKGRDGASEAAASAGAVATQLTRQMVERWLDTSRLELGPRRSAACLAEGSAMSWERAIEYALKG